VFSSHNLRVVCGRDWKEHQFLLQGNAVSDALSEATPQAALRGTQRRMVLFASMFGSVIEWYDFLLYGTATALVFNKQFFPTQDPFTGLIAAFGVYAAGFVARPLGALLCGHFGDRRGRKTMLVATVVMMGGGTFLIGCLPTYGQIGVTAPVLLVLLRVAQGIGFGGEWGGAVLLAVEHMPRNRRGLAGSIVQMGYPLGIIASIGAFATLSFLPQDQFLSWGWRVPFWLSLILLVPVLVVRLRIDESPVFAAAARRRQLARLPIAEVLESHLKSFLLALGLKLSETAFVSIVSIFSLSYVTLKLGLPKSVILNGVLLGAALETVTIPLCGWLSDKYGRKTMFFIGCGFSILAAFPLFELLDTRNPTVIATTIAIAMSLGQASMFGPGPAWMAELFPTHVRYTGASAGFQLGGALAGGFVPLLATVLLKSSEGDTWGISCLIIGIAIVTLVATIAAPETSRSDLG
jgi:MFS transporter, MHS family, shikimate and dehydroshikimate transport protein